MPVIYELISCKTLTSVMINMYKNNWLVRVSLVWFLLSKLNNCVDHEENKKIKRNIAQENDLRLQPPRLANYSSGVIFVHLDLQIK